MAKPTAVGKAAAARTVRMWRAELNLTQQELAQQAGINVDTLSDLESGSRWPRTKTLRAVERAAGQPPGELDRVAEKGETSGEPVVPPTIMASIDRTLPEGDPRREAVIDAIVQALKQQALSGTGPMPVAPVAQEPGRHRRRASG